MERDSKPPDFEPPAASVTRIVKSVLPDHVTLGKDARMAFGRAAGIFIIYLTACANDFCRDAKRQTITANDVFSAIQELEFSELEEPLRVYLEQFRRDQAAKKASKAGGSKRAREEEEEEEAPNDDNKQAGGEAERRKTSQSMDESHGSGGASATAELAAAEAAVVAAAAAATSGGGSGDAEVKMATDS